jgi:hypothetical protein
LTIPARSAVPDTRHSRIEPFLLEDRGLLFTPSMSCGAMGRHRHPRALAGARRGPEHLFLKRRHSIAFMGGFDDTSRLPFF